MMREEEHARWHVRKRMGKGDYRELEGKKPLDEREEVMPDEWENSVKRGEDRVKITEDEK